MIKLFKPIQVLSFSRIPKQSFAIFSAYLNPERHITMNHNPHNAYEDIVMIGDYPMPNRAMKKEINRDYIPQIADIVFSVVKSKNPKFNLTSKDYDEIRVDSWKKHGVEDFNEIKFDVLEALSNQIFVKEHKYRYTIEQKVRFASTTDAYSKFDMNEHMIAFLIETYNGVLRAEIERSHLWHSPKIKGDKSFIEKYNEANNRKGINDLRRDNYENKTFINRLMNALHSV